MVHLVSIFGHNNAAAANEVPLITYTASNCPCASLPGTSPYLGNNWYCESGNPHPFNPISLNIMSNCEGTCCSNDKSPPWFNTYTELLGPTNDDMEVI